MKFAELCCLGAVGKWLLETGVPQCTKVLPLLLLMLECTGHTSNASGKSMCGQCAMHQEREQALRMEVVMHACSAMTADSPHT